MQQNEYYHKYFVKSEIITLLEPDGVLKEGCVSQTIGGSVFYRDLVSAFAYTMSVFTGQETSGFSVSAKGNFIPVHIDCTDCLTSDFIGKVTEILHDIDDLEGISDVGVKYYHYLFNAVSDCNATRNQYMDLLLYTKSDGSNTVLTLDFSNRHSLEKMTVFLKTVVQVLDGLGRYDRLSKIPLCDSDEIATLESLHGKDMSLSANSIVDVFSDSVMKYADSVCIFSGDETRTYKQVGEGSDRVASSLQSLGIGKGDLVAFLIPRCALYLDCTLGILKTGAAYVPLDNDYPDARVFDCIDDSGSKCILVNDSTEERVKGIGLKIPIINIDNCAHTGYKPVSFSPDDLFAVVYTSGTSGRPKGIGITNRAAMNHIDEIVAGIDIHEGDVYGFFASIGFIAHVSGIHLALSVGGSVDIVPTGVRKDIRDLLEHLVSKKVTHTFITPQVAKIIVSKKIPIRIIGVGGESTSDLSCEKGSPFIIVYGMTETTSIATWIMASDRKYPSSVGKVVRNMRIYIIDRHGRRVPPGAVGEMCFSGAQVSCGYIGKTAADSFRPNPFCDDGSTIFKTGDMARFLPDGTIGFCGRADSQVKIRGNRVELSEVNSAIAAIPGMKQVTVLAVDGNGNKELCAYVVCPSEVSDESIRNAVLSKRPSFMVPKFIVRLESLPMTVNGKIDRSKLPMPDIDALRADYVAPRNALETFICSAFSEVLGIEKIGIDDDFLALGGDSLSAMKLQNTLSTGIRYNDIIRLRTPRKIAEHQREGNSHGIHTNKG